jgi:hypothetical protein
VVSGGDPPWPGSTIETIIMRLAAAPARAGATRVLAIDGPSGAGKTTLAAAVANRLENAPVVHLDHLYPGWDGLAAAVPRLVAWVLEPLAAGRPARYRRFDWPSARYAEWHTLPKAPALVVEGAGAGARAAASYLSLLVWADAPEPVRHRRALARDGETYRPHWERWARQERAHFAAEGTRARAEVTLGETGAEAGDPPDRGVG